MGITSPRRTKGKASSAPKTCQESPAIDHRSEGVVGGVRSVRRAFCHAHLARVRYPLRTSIAARDLSNSQYNLPDSLPTL
jgi:hypothetical protein